MNSTFTTSVEHHTLTVEDLNKARLLLSNHEDPFKELFDRNGFSVETDVLFVPMFVGEKVGLLPKYIVPHRYIEHGLFVKNGQEWI